MAENQLLPPVPGRPLTDLERAQRREARTFDNQLRHYLGPHLTQGVNNLAKLLQIFGPQADMQDMVEFSRSSGDAMRRGDIPGAMRDFGYAAMAPLGVALPGSVSSYRKAGEAVVDKVADVAARRRPDERVEPTAWRESFKRGDYMQGFLESAYAGAGVAAEGTNQ